MPVFKKRFSNAEGEIKLEIAICVLQYVEYHSNICRWLHAKVVSNKKLGEYKIVNFAYFSRETKLEKIGYRLLDKFLSKNISKSLKWTTELNSINEFVIQGIPVGQSRFSCFWIKPKFEKRMLTIKGL